MNPKTLIWIGVFVGGAIGGFLPVIWGGSMVGVSSVVFSTVGGLVGIWAGWRLSQMI